MTNNLRRTAFAAIAAIGSLGLLHCNLAKDDPSGRQSIEQPKMNEPAPSAVGGGPTMTPPPAPPEAAKVDSAAAGTARGISAVEQYLDGKGTGVNRFALDGLTYEQGCPYLTQQGVDSVDALSDELTKHPTAKISIESYADNLGSDEANKQLTQKRADVIKRQLVRCGIEPNRIQTSARGEQNPLASNDTDDGQAQNRRTEIVVIQK